MNTPGPLALIEGGKSTEEAQPHSPVPPQKTLGLNGVGKGLHEFKTDILIVDDREDKLLALEATLLSLGQNIIKARSGGEALRYLLKQQFAVILMDVSMPAMDGFETASLIRQRLSSEHTPIIFITAIGGSETHVSRGYSLGAVDYIMAPIMPEVLRTKVSVFVELHRNTEVIKRQAEKLRQDLAARNEAEEKIRQLNEELEHRVAALTEVNRELEAFNYSIAHDFRAPLRSMSGFAQALVEEEADKMSPLGLDYARRIVRSAKYMDNLLLDMLTYSRLVRSEMPPVALRLEDTVQELLSILDHEIRERGIAVEISSPLGCVFAHPPTLKQILANLVGNSLKFASPERAPKVRIFTTREHAFVRLWVEDNGIGIAPQFHEKIFGLFQRLHDAQAYPGTGIGLALVRKGAERMGGRAGVESHLGEGSRFWVELPLAEDPTGGA
jgi:two-component system, sensor histidine kinase and response regulator